MKLIDNRNTTDPSVNLALEEFVVRNLCDDDFVLVYVNDRSVILGKHQNLIEEVDLSSVRQAGIPVLRRISGGGAVYHDPGNLNFALFTGQDPKKFNNYEPFLRPIINGLGRLGLQTAINNRNSLVIADGRKISGNAQFTSRERMMSHGTLLFDADLDMLETVLRPRAYRVVSHAVQSIRSRVVNVGARIDAVMTMGQFRDRVAQWFAGEKPEIRRLSGREWDAVIRLADEKYRTWEWNIGRSPRFAVEHAVGTDRETVGLRLTVVDGVIDAVDVASIPRSDRDRIERALTGMRYDPDEVNRTAAGLVGGFADHMPKQQAEPGEE